MRSRGGAVCSLRVSANTLCRSCSEAMVLTVVHHRWTRGSILTSWQARFLLLLHTSHMAKASGCDYLQISCPQDDCGPSAIKDTIWRRDGEKSGRPRYVTGIPKTNTNLWPVIRYGSDSDPSWPYLYLSGRQDCWSVAFADPPGSHPHDLFWSISNVTARQRVTNGAPRLLDVLPRTPRWSP